MIFAPIDHVGWRSASVGVTTARRAAGHSRNGPPDAVSVTRATSDTGRPARHWWTAECSLSTGRSSPPPRRSARITSSPPATSDSLLASASRFPASSAASVAPSPANPTTALRTMSIPDDPAASSSASAPNRHSPGQRGAKSPGGGVPSTTRSGFRSRARRSSASHWRFAVSTAARNRSGCRRMTSSVAAPTDPVAPRTATFFTPDGSGYRVRLGNSRDKQEEEERGGDRPQDGVEPVQHAPRAPGADSRNPSRRTPA